MLEWIQKHFNTLHYLQINTLITDKNGNKLLIDEGFESYIAIVKSIRNWHSKVMFIGNGGSAGIASHLAIDYSKNGRLPAMVFSDISAATCLSNDYGYEYVFAKQIQFHGQKQDVLVAISSSGSSLNILRAVTAARSIGCQVITFSGFDIDNPLRQLGDLNFYIDSKEYGFVEVAHMSLGHALLDYIVNDQNAAMAESDRMRAASN